MQKRGIQCIVVPNILEEYSDYYLSTTNATTTTNNNNDDNNNNNSYYYTVFQKKTPTHIIGYKLRSSCLILIIFDTKIPHIIWHHMTAYSSTYSQ